MNTRPSPSLRPRLRAAAFGLGILGLGALCLAACGPTRPRQASPELLRDFNEGVASLDQYNYPEAYRSFEKVLAREPGLVEARFNLALAAFNLGGLKEAEKKKEEQGAPAPAGQGGAPRAAAAALPAIDLMEAAEEHCVAALKLAPDLHHARFLLGLIYHRSQRLDEALAAFAKIAAADPQDPYVLYWHAKCLEDTDRLPEAVRVFERLLEAQPAFGSALWRLSQLYRRVGAPEKAARVLDRFKGLRDGKEEILAGDVYGEGGKYYSAIRDLEVARGGFRAPDGPRPATEPGAAAASPALAVGDVNADGRLDAVVCKQTQPGGGSAAELWLGGEDGACARSQAFRIDGSAAALGDVDGDRDLDLVLAAEGRIQLLVNDGPARFAPGAIALPAELQGSPVRILLFDADSDWDVDVAVASSVKRPDGTIGGRLALFNNNRDGSFADIAPGAGIAEWDAAPLDFRFGDLDGDIDQDLIVLDARGGVHALLNDRLWTYRRLGPKETGVAAAGAAALDLVYDDGGRPWLRVAGAGDFVSTGPGRFQKGDGVAPAGLAAADPPHAALAPQADGRRRTLVAAPAGGLAQAVDPQPLESWIGIELNGPKNPNRDKGGIWSNLSGIGAVVEVRAGAFRAVQSMNGLGGGSSRAAARLLFALPPGTQAVDYVRILWPDGILQSEPKLAAQKLHPIEEVERKPTSCPLLFAWDGERFAYIGDFLGVGGLGYFEAPGVYSRPDSTELIEIPGLAPRSDTESGAVFELRITEPLEECTYLDRAALLVADHPAAMSVHPEEMFAVGGPPPGHALVAYRVAALPRRAVDHRGADVTEALRAIDRVFADKWRRDPRFPGVAEADHAVLLDFEDGIDRVLDASPRPVLLLHGYVEYAYSSSNFASSQAKVAMRAPSVAVERGGRWIALRKEWGFPGGTPRWMAIDLAGLLRKGDRRLRVDTNFEIYWDHALLAAADDGAAARGELRLTELSPDGAELRALGFPRGELPNGGHPRIYDYHDLETIDEIVGKFIRPFPGRLTRFGDVRPLLDAADDRFVIFGPGDEVALRYRAKRLPALPAGWKRTYFLKADGWCKDRDLYTAHPDSIDPLPYRAMDGYPSKSHAFDADPARRLAADAYHTRWVREAAGLGPPWGDREPRLPIENAASQ